MTCFTPLRRRSPRSPQLTAEARVAANIATTERVDETPRGARP